MNFSVSGANLCHFFQKNSFDFSHICDCKSLRIITFGDSIFHLNTETPLFCYSHCSERTNSCRGSMYRERFAGQLRSSKSQLHHSTTGIKLVWLPSWWRLPLSYSFVVARCQIHCIMITLKRSIFKWAADSMHLCWTDSAIICLSSRKSNPTLCQTILLFYCVTR